MISESKSLNKKLQEKDLDGIPSREHKKLIPSFFPAGGVYLLFVSKKSSF